MKKDIKWIKIDSLYGVLIDIDDFAKRKKATLRLFRSNTDKLPFDIYEHYKYYRDRPFLKERNGECRVLTALKEYFIIEEIEQIKKYLGKFTNVVVKEIFSCKFSEDNLPIPIHMGLLRPTQGFHHFFQHENYTLPFYFSGYFDLNLCSPIENEDDEND